MLERDEDTESSYDRLKSMIGLNSVKKQMDEEIWDEEKRFLNPHEHFVDFSPKYYKMKMDLIESLYEERGEA